MRMLYERSMLSPSYKLEEKTSWKSEKAQSVSMGVTMRLKQSELTEVPDIFSTDRLIVGLGGSFDTKVI